MSRRNTIARPAWRTLHHRADGTTFDQLFIDAHFESVNLKPGETLEYQIRQSGQPRFQTWATRDRKVLQ